jgi:hypothetical protein
MSQATDSKSQFSCNVLSDLLHLRRLEGQAFVHGAEFIARGEAKLAHRKGNE